MRTTEESSHELNKLLSDKYTLYDILKTDKKRRTIKTLIDKSPILLWRLIHKKHSNVSLVRNAYARLKAKVRKIKPELVTKAEKDHKYHKAKKMLRKELREGSAGKPGSRFKKIASRKVVK